MLLRAQLSYQTTTTSPQVSCSLLPTIITQLIIENLVPEDAGSVVPQMQKILHIYRAEGHYNHEFAPFQNSYIGEHIEFYQPGTIQLAGLPRSYPFSRSNMSISESNTYFSV